MRISRKLAAASFMFATSLAASAGIASADSRMFVAYLYGGNEVPAAGDPDAFGIATVVLTSTTALCYSIIVRNAAKFTSAHIHSGVAGASGAPAVTFPIPAGGVARHSVCLGSIVAATITDIRNNPQNFYVNVHNGAFGGGAARGQLQ